MKKQSGKQNVLSTVRSDSAFLLFAECKRESPLLALAVRLSAPVAGADTRGVGLFDGNVNRFIVSGSLARRGEGLLLLPSFSYPRSLLYNSFRGKKRSLIETFCE